jgi:hypothetical protein
MALSTRARAAGIALPHPLGHAAAVQKLLGEELRRRQQGGSEGADMLRHIICWTRAFAPEGW